MKRPPPANYGVVRDPSAPFIHIAWDDRPGPLLTAYGLAAGRAMLAWAAAAALVALFSRTGA